MGFELSPNADGKVIENADSKITKWGEFLIAYKFAKIILKKRWKVLMFF